MSASTVLAALTQAVLEAAVELGFDRDALVAAAALEPAWLADPDTRVPFAQHFKLWEAIAARPVGLELGARLGLSGLGVLGYATQHHASVGDALAWLQRFRDVVHPDVMPRYRVRDERLVFAQVIPAPFARLREPVDTQASATVAFMRALAGPDARPLAVALSGPAPADPSRHEAFFACPVTWAAPAVEVAFDAALLARPLPRSDARLFGYLARRAEALLAELPASATLAERVRREIAASLADGEPRLEAIARRLGVSERTLHRRLRDEDTGFAALVDEARRERALLLLGDPHLSASEVAFLLGFGEPAGFFRAFRRWTGETPQAWRRRGATV